MGLSNEGTEEGQPDLWSDRLWGLQLFPFLQNKAAVLSEALAPNKHWASGTALNGALGRP